MIDGVDVVGVHIKRERASLFILPFCYFHCGLADADKSVYHASTLLVETLYPGSESAPQEFDDRLRIRRKQAGGNVPQTRTGVAVPEPGCDEPIIAEGVRYECGAFAIRPVCRFAHAAGSERNGTGVECALVRRIAIFYVHV